MGTERLVVIVDVEGQAGHGKTAACAAIVREIAELVGPGASYKFAGDRSEIYARAFRLPPVEFDRNKVNVEVQVFHDGA